MDDNLRKRLKLLSWVLIGAALVVGVTVKLPRSLPLILLICAAAVFAAVVIFGRYRRSRRRR